MQRILMQNSDGQWYATGVNQVTDLVDHWSDSETDAVEFMPKRAADLVYRYNRRYRGEAKAHSERVRHG